MKRLQRAIIAILCVVCLAFGVFACDETPAGDSDKATYTVTVTGGTPVLLTTVTVKLQDANGNDATEAKTLTNGKASFSLKKGTYTVVLDAAAGFGKYTVQDGVKTLTASKTSTTIELKEEEDKPKYTDYKVRFMLNSTTPFANGAVQICDESSACHSTKTDEDGYASWNVPATTYHVIVLQQNWPKGYNFDDTKYSLSATTRELVVTFGVNVEHTVSVKYATYDTATEKWELSEPAANVELKVLRFDDRTVDYAQYEKVKTDANGEATFSAPAVDLWIDVASGVTAGYVQEVGTTTYMDGSDDEAELTIGLYPVGSTKDACAELKLNTATQVSVLASGEFWYEFKPAQSGVYELTSTGTVDASCAMPSANSGTGEISESNVKDGDNFTVMFNVGASELGGDNRWVFKISAGEGTFSINLTRKGDYEEPVTLERIEVVAEHVVASADMPAIPDANEYKFKSLNDDLPLKKDPTTGFYHLENYLTGPIVYVMIGGKYAPAGISGGFQGIIESPTGTKEISITDGETFSCDYTQFIKDYIKGLNADGLHPLNDELKTFVERYNATQLMGEGKCYYACGVYASIYNQPIGDGMVQVGDYRFEVAAGETKTMTYTHMNQSDTKQAVITVTSGNVKLLDSEDAEQTKLVVPNYGTFKIKNEGDASETVILHVEYKTADKQITAVGEYLVIASYFGEGYTFTVPATDTYTFTLDDGACEIELVIDDESSMYYGDPIELTKNKAVTINVLRPVEATEDSIVKLTIDYSTGGGTSVAGTLNIGANSVTGAYNGATDSGTIYAFTADEDGDYTVTVSEDGMVIIGDNEYTLVGNDEASNSETIHLTAGTTILLGCSPSDFDVDSATFTVTITKA